LAATGSLLILLGGSPAEAQLKLPGAPQQLQSNQKQANNKANKSQRVEQLQTALANDDRALDILMAQEPPSTAKNHRQTSVETLQKARDATQRLLNDVQGNNVDQGVEASHKRERAAAKTAQPPTDRYAALLQARQLLEQNYNILSQDSGEKNTHRTNAMKFTQQVRTPLQQEIDAYAAAHPEVQAAQAAQPAASPIAGQTPAGQANATRAQDLEQIIPHLDHSIDMTNAQTADSANLKQKTLDALVSARDTVRQLLGQAQGRAAADLAKDVENDRTRDAAKRNDNNQTGYQALVRIQQYLRNDHAILDRQTDDATHLKAKGLNYIEQAQGAVQQQIDAYLKAHPEQKR